jgi:DNA replication and repair protein RecF
MPPTHITALRLAQFRSHRLTQLALDGRPVVLTGPNGAGKTNLLEAVSLLSPGRGLRRAGAEDLARHAGGAGWQVGADLTRGTARHVIETGALPGQPRWLRIDDKSAPQSALGRLSAMVWLTPAMDRLWLEGPEGRRRFLDRLALAFAPDHAEHALAYDKALRDRNRLLRDGVTDPAWFTALESTMAEAGAAMTATRRATLDRLAEAAEPDGAFPAADLSLSCETPADPLDLASLLARGRRADMAAGRSLTGPHRADLGAVWAARAMPAALCSTGEQKALLISILLAHARALSRTSGHPPILLLDEVAAHLDAARRAALYDALCRLGGQAFLTGTEPDLFAALGDRAQRFMLSDGPQGSDWSEGSAS